MKFSFRRSLALTAVVCAGLAALPADAKTFRWANSGDVSSMDPYARQETFLLTFPMTRSSPSTAPTARAPTWAACFPR